MDFEAYVISLGLDPATLTAQARAGLQTAWRALHGPKQQAGQANGAATGNIPVAQHAPEQTGSAGQTQSQAQARAASPFHQEAAAFKANAERMDTIQKLTKEAMKKHSGDKVMLEHLEKLCESACADEKIEVRDFQLKLFELAAYRGPIVFAPSAPQVNETVLEAAICAAHKLAGHEKQFDDQTLQAAHARFRGGISLKELLALAGERNNGYRGTTRDIKALCRAAFGGRMLARGGADDFRADVGPSTIDVAGILSNVANKSLGAAWLFSEQSWRRIAKVTSAGDFKQMSEYRLNGAAKFEKIAKGGEIKHGTLSDTTYTNQVENYGKLIGISYEDMVNDDLGAFISVTQELSRGGSDSFNEVFWTEFLDDAAFFPTDKSLGNYDDGATDSVLSIAGLNNADAIFAAQTKPDGTPLGAIPRILLVPRTLRATGSELMTSAKKIGQGLDRAAVPENNPWVGMFELVASLYLASSAISGSSSTAWYLGADPMDIAAMWVAFLNGQETPIVETGEFDFNRLGLAMRAYMAFGVRKKEYRAMVKLKGAA